MERIETGFWPWFSGLGSRVAQKATHHKLIGCVAPSGVLPHRCTFLLYRKRALDEEHNVIQTAFKKIPGTVIQKLQEFATVCFAIGDDVNRNKNALFGCHLMWTINYRTYAEVGKVP